MIWQKSWRADPEARALADRHYSRQTVGAAQFVPPGRCLVLTAPRAYWVTSWPLAEYTRHAWAGSWVCSAFRREGGEVLASEMILQAVAATRWKWPDAGVGMVTFVDRRKVRGKRDPGYCFLCAGFRRVGETKGGLTALYLDARDMPDPEPPALAQLALDLD